MKTFKNYSEYAEHPISEKITLAHVSCKQRCYGFTNVSGDIYSASAPLFVVACHKGTSSLTEVSSSGDVTASSYYFDSLTSKIYVHSSNGFIDEETDPEIIPTYRMFFSSAPINLSYDLTNNLATQVYYEPRIKDSPGFSSKLDNDQTGISVTGSGTLTLDNGDLFFKQYYDLFIFENQEIKIYSYHRSLDVNQAKILYSGNITDKTYRNKNDTIKVKDDINKLKEAISLGKISDITDPINVSEEVGTYFKRRIYGTLSKLKVQSVDMLWDNTTEDETFTLGFVSGQIGSKKLTGSNFISLICSGDKIVVGNQELTVETIYNDTTMIVSEELEVNYVNAVAKVSPDVSFYNKNRKFLVCGHSLQDVVTTVTDVIERNRISVASTTGLRVGDYVQIADQYISIKRISGLKLILNQNLAVVPPVGTEVRKMQIQKVQIRYPDDLSKKTIVLNKEDYSLSTTTEGTYLNISEKAEVNATLPKTIQGNYYTIFGFDMVWLGIPTMFRVDTVANVSDSLVGKYFSLYSDRSEVVFWFSKKVDSDYDQTEPPEFYVDISPSNIDVSGNRININAHGLTEGQNVSFSAPTGSLPGGIVENYNYFVRDVETNYFKISADANSEIRDITSSGSGSIHVILSKNMFEISLPSPNLTANQVAELVAESIPTSLSTYLTQVDLNKVTVYSKSGRDLQAGVAGTSGFSVIKLIKGQESDQAINLQKLIRTRDYIKMSGESDDRYVEVLDVYSDSLRVREQMSIGGTNKLHVKNVGYVDNNSYIYVDCFGKVDTNGELIADAASVVKDLLNDSGLSGRIDSQSFTYSSQAIPYMMSLKIPYSIADSETTLKDVIDDINKTVLGSLVLTDTLQLAYNVLDVERLAEDLDVITDSDRLSWSIKSTGSNYKYIVSHYDFSDIDSEPSTEYVYTSDFSEKYTKSEIFLDIDLHLKNQDEAEEASQRRLFYNTLSRADITIKGDLNLAKYNMGDKVIINFRDLYLRLGNNSSNRIICSVSSVKRTGEEVELIVTTQGGNIYSRNALISSNYSPSFDNASEDEKLFSSYITENNGTINNDNSLVGCNSIA